MHCLLGSQDSSPLKSPTRKKTTFKGSFHRDNDYQFALAVKESFKTLPQGFNVEEFERSQLIVGGGINRSESSTVGEELMPATSANPTTQTSDLNLDTLATATREKFDSVFFLKLSVVNKSETHKKCSCSCHD